MPAVGMCQVAEAASAGVHENKACEEFDEEFEHEWESSSDQDDLLLL